VKLFDSSSCVKLDTIVVFIFVIDPRWPSLSITTKVVRSNPVHGEVYLIQYYVIKVVNDLRNIVESGVKHHKPQTPHWSKYYESEIIVPTFQMWYIRYFKRMWKCSKCRIKLDKCIFNVAMFKLCVLRNILAYIIYFFVRICDVSWKWNQNG
jgi:hypothetical protein